MSDLVEMVRNEQEFSDSSTLKTINSLLNSVKTRIEGLQLLKLYLPHCSDKDFLECCINWMQDCCKIEGFTKNSDLAVDTLNDLFKTSTNYTELNKSVSFFITTRFFDYFFKYFPDSHAGWSCAQTCFSCYRGPCGPSAGTIEKHLMNHVEKNVKISTTIAKCFALLPSLGGGGNDGINYQSNWKNQVVRTIKLCHSVLNDLFAVVDELQEYDTDGHVRNNIENERNTECLTVQLYNYCKILYFMLLNKYPAPKCIPSDLILQLICRGLAVNPSAIGKNPTTDTIALQKVLPEVHVILHSLLNALIVTCKNQLLPYCHLICKLIKQSLEWTNSDFTYGTEKPFGEVRISAYESFSNWLVATSSGSQVETISKVVVLNCVSDIHPKRETILLKESTGKNQQPKEQKKISRISRSANGFLCYSALKALQFLLKFSGITLNQHEHKFLQETVVKLLVDIQNSFLSDIPVPFSLSTCRRELYSLLLELIYQSCPSRPPPTHFALRIFSNGINDRCPEVSQFCSTSLNLIGSIIHPQFCSALFWAPTETMSDSNRERELQWKDQSMEVDIENAVTCEKEALNSANVNEKTVEVNESSSSVVDKCDSDLSERVSDPSEENESICSKKDKKDEDEDIIKTFDNSFID